jgi:hypothetical protein
MAKDTKEITRICKSKKTDNTMANRYQRDNKNLQIEEDRKHNGKHIPKR